MSAKVSPMKVVSGISASEFLHAINLVCRNGLKKVSNRNRSFCIAVSGGSDSMALAFLCQQLREQHSRDNHTEFNFISLIVDHQIRRNSHFEAMKTKERLRQMGMYAEIIRVEWPARSSPSNSPFVETIARRLRYQALGKACARLGLSKILLAHHEDDQAETVLMNFAASINTATIRPMDSVAAIPECEGIHGVSCSGVFERAVDRLLRMHLQNRQHSEPQKYEHLKKIVENPPIFESGGVEIKRPLLGFSKERLRQTCIDNSVEWEEDSSNHDVRVTTRNTIRSLLSNGRLPLALRKPSLLRIKDQVVARAKKGRELGNTILESCEVLKLDVRSGILMLRFNPSVLPSRLSKSLARYAAIQFLTEIAWVVTPQKSLSLTSFVNAADLMFPDLQDPDIRTTGVDDEALSFTASGVNFQRRRLKKTNLLPSQPAVQQRDDDADSEFIWIMTRQPLSRLFHPEPCVFSTSRSIQRWPTELSNKSTIPLVDQHGNSNWSWSTWQLWDGRYWIRVRHPKIRTFVLRTWREDEMPAIRARVAPGVYDRFRNALRDAAPGKVRWTLPVIAEVDSITNHGKNFGASTKDEAQDSTGRNKLEHSPMGRIVVFPTLGTAGWLDVLNQDGGRKLEWEVRYKRISLRLRDGKGQLWSHNPKDVIAWDDGGQGEPTVRLPEWDD